MLDCSTDYPQPQPMGWIPRMRKGYPKIHVVDDQRFVDNGRIVTTAGLSAGMNGALHLVELSSGRPEAQQLALYLEYNWQRDHPFVRASLADKQLPNLDLKPVGEWTLSTTAGDQSHWRIAFDGGKGKDAAQIMSCVATRLPTDKNWQPVSTSGEGRNIISNWTFTGRDGRPWDGSVAIEPMKTDSSDYRITFVIARKGGRNAEAGGQMTIRTL
jgi:hypothetical protein